MDVVVSSFSSFSFLTLVPLFGVWNKTRIFSEEKTIFADELLLFQSHFEPIRCLYLDYNMIERKKKHKRSQINRHDKTSVHQINVGGKSIQSDIENH